MNEPTDTTIWQWLLGLRRIDPSDADALLGWRYPLPPWVWLLILCAAVGVAVLCYRAQIGSKLWRCSLAAIRAAIVLLLVVLLTGPMLVLPREQVEPDHVLILLDRSGSMSVEDSLPGQDIRGQAAEAGPISRDRQLIGLLADNRALWDTLARDHRLDWYGFSDRLSPLDSYTTLPDPGGRTTAIPSAIDESLRRASGRPVSAIVLMTDGRSGEPLGADTIEQLKRQDVPVYAVPLGNPTPMLDLSLEAVDAPSRAFVGDIVPVSVSVTLAGGANAPPPGTTVRLIDPTTGQLLDEQPVESTGEPVRLLHTPTAAGEATWEVVLHTPEPELSLTNNRRAISLAFEDRPIRVLYVEGAPRWEYRYLKNMLLREKSLSASILLLSADREFAQEGDVPLQRLPATADEMRQFDVILIGDLPADYLTAEQMRLIHEQVASGGAGLILIAGPDNMPLSYMTSPLAPLLPLSSAPSMNLLPAPIVFQPTPTARATGVMVLRSGGDGAASADWPADLPPLMWAQSIQGLKPAVEVLAEDAATHAPLVVRMRFGAGQSLYLASDESWRWRKPWGERYMDPYWTQLIRLMARGRVEGGANERIQLDSSHRRATTGDTITLTLRIRDQSLLDENRSDTEVAVTEATDTQQTGPRGHTPQQQAITLTATGEQGVYRGEWVPRFPGTMKITPADPSLAPLGVERRVEIADPDSEMRYPIADHALLTKLADETGGAVVDGAQLPSLQGMIRNRARISTADISEPLTRSPLALALLLLLLTAEWIGRKWMGYA